MPMIVRSGNTASPRASAASVDAMTSMHASMVRRRSMSDWERISMATGCWLLVAGYWLLDTGCWILVAGYWLLVVRRRFGLASAVDGTSNHTTCTTCQQPVTSDQ